MQRVVIAAGAFVIAIAAVVLAAAVVSKRILSKNVNKQTKKHEVIEPKQKMILSKQPDEATKQNTALEVVSIEVSNYAMAKNIKAISRQEYVLFENQLLGNGASGYVYLGKNVKSNANVALKLTLSIEPYKETSEVVALTALGFIPGLIGLLDYGFIHNGYTQFMVLQYFEGGMNLVDYKSAGGFLMLPTAMAAFWQLIVTTEAMLSASIVHLDLRPWNILYYEETKSIRVCDLGSVILKPRFSEVDDVMDFEFCTSDINVLANMPGKDNPSTENLSRAVRVYMVQLGECLKYLLKMAEPANVITEYNVTPAMPTMAQKLLDKMSSQRIHGGMRWLELYQDEFVKDCKKAYLHQV